MAVKSPVNSFGRLADLVRDIFKIRIESLFKSETMKQAGLLKEIPIIEKYEISAEGEEGQFLTAVKVIEQFPDLSVDKPLIAVTSIGGIQKVLSLGTQYIDTEFHKPFVQGTVIQPFSLVDGDTFIVETRSGIHTAVFNSWMFQDISNVSGDRLAEMINVQIPDLSCFVTDTGYLVIRAKKAPDFVKIKNGSLNSKIGVIEGSEDNSDNYVPQGVYQIAEDMDISLDVVAYDRIQRNEVMDILADYFGFYLEKDIKYNWYGETDNNENWQIIFQNKYRRRGESEISLEASPPRDKLYVDGFVMPVIAIGYIKRNLVKISELETDIYGVLEINKPN